MGSRYPSLDGKAMMAGAGILEDSLSFEAVIVVEDNAPLLSEAALLHHQLALYNAGRHDVWCPHGCVVLDLVAVSSFIPIAEQVPQ